MLSVSLFIDEMSCLPAPIARPLRSPAIAFRIPDYPTLVIRPLGAMYREKEGEAWTLSFTMGKSCLIEWDKQPPERIQLLLILVDLVDEPESARPTAGATLDGNTSEGGKGMFLGRAVHVESLASSAVAGFSEFDVRLRDLVGNPVGFLHAVRMFNSNPRSNRNPNSHRILLHTGASISLEPTSHRILALRARYVHLDKIFIPHMLQNLSQPFAQRSQASHGPHIQISPSRDPAATLAADNHTECAHTSACNQCAQHPCDDGLATVLKAPSSDARGMGCQHIAPENATYLGIQGSHPAVHPPSRETSVGRHAPASTTPYTAALYASDSTLGMAPNLLRTSSHQPLTGEDAAPAPSTTSHPYSEGLGSQRHLPGGSDPSVGCDPASGSQLLGEAHLPVDCKADRTNQEDWRADYTLQMDRGYPMDHEVDRNCPAPDESQDKSQLLDGADDATQLTMDVHNGLLLPDSGSDLPGVNICRAQGLPTSTGPIAPLPMILKNAASPLEREGPDLDDAYRGCMPPNLFYHHGTGEEDRFYGHAAVSDCSYTARGRQCEGRHALHETSQMCTGRVDARETPLLPFFDRGRGEERQMRVPFFPFDLPQTTLLLLQQNRSFLLDSIADEIDYMRSTAYATEVIRNALLRKKAARARNSTPRQAPLGAAKDRTHLMKERMSRITHDQRRGISSHGVSSDGARDQPRQSVSSSFPKIDRHRAWLVLEQLASGRAGSSSLWFTRSCAFDASRQDTGLITSAAQEEAIVSPEALLCLQVAEQCQGDSVGDACGTRYDGIAPGWAGQKQSSSRSPASQSRTAVSFSSETKRAHSLTSPGSESVSSLATRAHVSNKDCPTAHADSSASALPASIYSSSSTELAHSPSSSNATPRRAVHPPLGEEARKGMMEVVERTFKRVDRGGMGVASLHHLLRGLQSALASASAQTQSCVWVVPLRALCAKLEARLRATQMSQSAALDLLAIEWEELVQLASTDSRADGKLQSVVEEECVRCASSQMAVERGSFGALVEGEIDGGCGTASRHSGGMMTAGDNLTQSIEIHGRGGDSNAGGIEERRLLAESARAARSPRPNVEGTLLAAVAEEMRQDGLTEGGRASDEPILRYYIGLTGDVHEIVPPAPAPTGLSDEQIQEVRRQVREELIKEREREDRVVRTFLQVTDASSAIAKEETETDQGRRSEPKQRDVQDSSAVAHTELRSSSLQQQPQPAAIAQTHASAALAPTHLPAALEPAGGPVRVCGRHAFSKSLVVSISEPDSSFLLF
ncbi:MAG: hypothetical protein SGPRY_004661 [Prymnesium sp.]